MLKGLDDEEPQQVSQIQTMTGQMDEAALTNLPAQAEQAGAQVPPESQEMAAAIRDFVTERLEEFGGGR